MQAECFARPSNERSRLSPLDLLRNWSGLTKLCDPKRGRASKASLGIRRAESLRRRQVAWRASGAAYKRRYKSHKAEGPQLES